MSTLKDLSRALADAVGAVERSVVRVSGGRGRWSGVAWDAHHVVTLGHGLHDDEAVVTDAGGADHVAAVVGVDAGTGLALLGVEAELPVPAWTDGADLRIGHLVLPVGRPARLGATLGMVSRLDHAWHTADGVVVDRWIDVDAELPRGFGGGPLADDEGRVIGINHPGLTPRGAVLPTATVRRVVERLRQHGSSAPGYLGVGFYPGELAAPVAEQVGRRDALIAVSVEPGGPGEAAGVLAGDALLTLDGTDVRGLRHLLGQLSARGAGAEVTLGIVRAGQPQQLAVTLGARPKRGGGGRGGPRRRRRGHGHGRWAGWGAGRWGGRGCR